MGVGKVGQSGIEKEALIIRHSVTTRVEDFLMQMGRKLMTKGAEKICMIGEQRGDVPTQLAVRQVGEGRWLGATAEFILIQEILKHAVEI